MAEENPEYQVIPDAETVARAHEGLQRQLADINALNPNSIVFGRPDLEKQYRDRFQSDFDTVTQRYGAKLPEPPSAEQLRREEFDAQWGGQPRIDEMRKSIFDALQADVGLDRWQLEGRAKELEKELGQERYAELVAAAGGTAKVPTVARGNRFALERLAATATYEAAYLKAKAAARL